jgi:adenine phosphoribosyltransferase
LKDAATFTQAVDSLVNHYKGAGIHKVVSIESRGFVLGGTLAYRLGCGFVPIRKPGKLPAETLHQEYTLEYGTDTIEIHKDAITAGERVLLHDDLLATGGTMRAAAELVHKLGGNIIGVCFLIELRFLNGRQQLTDYPVFSLIEYQN